MDLILGWVGGSEASFQGFLNGVLVFLAYLYYSHSVHTVFITIHAKFYSSSKEGSKPHLPHLHLMYITSWIDLLVHRVKG